MYTYESFEKLGIFILLRPIFATILIVMLILFIITISPKLRSKMASSYFVVGLSVISIIISAQLLFYSGIIVDELGLGGDEITTYMFLIILFLSIVNPVIYFYSHRRTNQSTVNVIK